MKLNNKGFALTSVIYMLIVLFLMTMLLILANLAQRKVVLDKIKSDVKQELNQGGVLAQNIYTVTFDPTIGQINQTSKQVKYNEPYGELPTPTREGYKFIGWGERTYETYDFIRYYDESNTLRISPDTHYQNSENQIIEAGDILIFDVSFSNANIQSIDIDDKVLDSSKYSIENGRVYGKINVETSMLKSATLNSQTVFLNFIDINYSSKPTNYTINKYILIKHDDIVSPQAIVTRGENHTLYAMWEKKESTFITGPEFNAKIKQLAGNPDATKDTDDTNITSIQRANSLPNFELTDNNIVSTSDSSTPTYAWYDNGTIYYYTEAFNPYTNDDSSYMFTRLKNLTSLNVSTFNTTKTTTMQSMFSICPKITTIDIGNFDTSNVTSMYAMFNFYDVNNISAAPSNLRQIILGERFNTNKVTNMRSMFAYCGKLESIDLSTFDTTNVTTMYHMFVGVNSITSLDLSTFNMTNVTDTSELIQYMNSLQELKTPKVYPSNSNITFVLPKTMYDSNNNAYTTLGSGSPTETLLKDTQTP